MAWTNLLTNEWVWTGVGMAASWVWGKLHGYKKAKAALGWIENHAEDWLPLFEIAAGKTPTKVDDKAVEVVKKLVTGLEPAQKDQLRELLKNG